MSTEKKDTILTLAKEFLDYCQMVNTRPGDLAAPQRERKKDSPNIRIYMDV